jgi:hypothetical protein
MITVATIATLVYTTGKEGLTMDLSAFITAGFVGLASGGFGVGAPIPIGAGVGAPTYGDVNASVVHSLLAEREAPAGSGIFVPIHKPSDFPFVTIVVDDGKGPAGGWQQAKARLPFTKFNAPIAMITWYCPITIGIPIRHSVRGYISPATAATMSAAVTNSVASRMDFDLPQGIFCRTFVTRVKAAFPTMYPVGATVGL